MRLLPTIALAAALALAAPLAAQGTATSAPSSASPDAERAAVLQVVTGLFDAMRTRDTAAMRSAFDSGVVLLSVGRTREGLPVVRRDAIGNFIASIPGAPAGKKLDERIYSPEVRIDGGLATVWTQYDFYLGDTFSHCGVDALMLGKTQGGWKIISLADTRQREGCPKR